jgi:hypothetical protein
MGRSFSSDPSLQRRAPELTLGLPRHERAVPDLASSGCGGKSDGNAQLRRHRDHTTKCGDVR